MNQFLRAANLVWDEVRSAARFALRWYRTHWLKALVGLAVALGVVGLCLPLDSVIPSGNTKAPWAVWMSYFGDFVQFNIVLFVALACYSIKKSSAVWLKIAVASLLCAISSGAVANVTRMATGRPRPFLGREDGLYGLRLDTDMQSLPSAHAATAFGGALPVLLLRPVVGLPLTAFATGVAAARLELRRHHLTDVLVSLVIAGFFSLPLAAWIKASVPPRESPEAQSPAPPGAS